MSKEFALLQQIKLLELARTPTTIVNRCSDGTTMSSLNNTNATYFSPKRSVTPTITANTLTAVITLNQPGVIDFLSVWASDTVARTIHARLTVNGKVVFDATTAPVSVVGTGLLLVGFGDGQGVFSPQPKAFSSLLFEVCSSITETGKLTFDASYHI